MRPKYEALYSKISDKKQTREENVTEVLKDLVESLMRENIEYNDALDRILRILLETKLKVNNKI
jgi:hypothetical protein